MRKVVDTNSLNSNALREFLADESNFAVLTDYTVMETLQADSAAGVQKNIAVLAEHPSQVLVLKNMAAVSRLKVKKRSRGLQRRLIDRQQTPRFKDWCLNVAAAADGDPGKAARLAELQAEAQAHLDLMTSRMGSYADNLAEAAKKFTPDELKILRTKQPLPPELQDKIVRSILMLTAQLYASQPQAVEPPQTAQLHNSFVFRFAVCAHLLDLKRIAAGGAKGANPAGLRNDAIDATFAAFATFFDGLITADAKAFELYENATFLLEQFRKPEGLEAQPEQPGATIS